MATTSTIFITATEARQNPLRERAVHDEGRAIESAILTAVADGLYETVVSNGTPMTESTPVATPVVSVDSVTGIFYVPNHSFKQGDAVQVSSTVTLPSPFTANGFYYVIYVDVDHVKLASSLQNALSDRPVAVSISDALTAIEIVDQGDGYFSAPTVSIVGGEPDTPATAIARLASYGAISAIGVNSHGEGYTDVPSVSIVAQGAGATAGTVTLKAVNATVAASGVNYRLGDILTVVGGTGTATTLTVLQTGIGGSVVAIGINSAGNYSTLPSLTAAATTVLPGGGSGCTVNLTMGLSAVAVGTGGSGYTASPRVLITGTGVDAAATAIVTAGTVSSIAVTAAGYGYTSIPTVTMTSGSGATAVAVLKPASVGELIVTNNGGNTYTAEPTVTISAQGAGATAGQVYMKVNSATLVNGGTGYIAGDTLLITGGAGTNNASIQVLTVGAFGEILTYVLATSGLYSQMPILDVNSVIGGSGTAAAFNLTMCVDSIAVANGGSGYVTPPTVTLASATGYGAIVNSVLDGDEVAELKVIANGTAYRDIPTVAITSGSGATSFAHLTPTGIDSFNITAPGYSYTSATVTIVGDGEGAEAHAVISGGEIVDIVVDNPGSGYTYRPTVTITGNGLDAVAEAVLVPTSLNYVDLIDIGSGYTGAPTVTLDGAATVRAALASTGVDRIDVVTDGENYTSNPIVNVIPSPDQVGVPTAPATTVSRGFSVESVTIVTTGSNYRSTPNVVISAPQGANGNVATATATIGIGQGTFSLHAYPASRDYFAAWKGTTISNSVLTRPYVDRMDTIVQYFTDLGYTINRQTNPATGNTLQWSVKW
jgi:hypothetical protein